ncbi:hypothetical protein H6B13_15360 [Bacteroides gallinaceum]|uniref:glycosyltransferase family 2 protein n=1 Tax=Bacteroides gallinaceum TaxID=1462571 RepID=UPI001959B1D1|nr:hypothetical protein [Bacteroides gallinaceum]MBM6720995.1 hypothetical protein [Bacteroides gallinaceum]
MSPILSICIPTFKRIDITRKAIASIYANLDGVQLNDFEVIVSDNDPEKSSEVFKKEFKYSNFHYYATKCEGFLNSYYVLGYGKGLFLKLHNNSCLLNKGSLLYLVNQIKFLSKEKPLLFYTNGMLNRKKLLKYNSTDEFYKSLSYFMSWSAGFGIWKDDYEQITITNISDMFPQTSLLLSCKNKNLFYIDDTLIYGGIPVPQKGGYNPYKVFGEVFMDLIKNALEDNIISNETFGIIKKELLNKYLASRYFKTVILRKDKFETSDISKHLKKYYGSYAFSRLLLYSFISPFYKIKR